MIEWHDSEPGTGKQEEGVACHVNCEPSDDGALKEEPQFVFAEVEKCEQSNHHDRERHDGARVGKGGQKPPWQESEVSQRAKQVFSSLNRTPDSEPDEGFRPAPTPHDSDGADTQSDKEENCTEQNVWDPIAKQLKLICQGRASTDRITLCPHLQSVRSITVNERHVGLQNNWVVFCRLDFDRRFDEWWEARESLRWIEQGQWTVNSRQ
jgi:hypothetical protein